MFFCCCGPVVCGLFEQACLQAAQWRSGGCGSVLFGSQQQASQLLWTGSVWLRTTMAAAVSRSSLRLLLTCLCVWEEANESRSLVHHRHKTERRETFFSLVFPPDSVVFSSQAVRIDRSSGKSPTYLSFFPPRPAGTHSYSHPALLFLTSAFSPPVYFPHFSFSSFLQLHLDLKTQNGFLPSAQNRTSSCWTRLHLCPTSAAISAF